SASASLLHLELGVQALLVAEDRRDGERLARLHVSDSHVALARIAIDHDVVPLLRVTDVVDAHVVVRAPEAWHLRERLPPAPHVARGRLAHALRHDPVLHANALPTLRIRPPRDVAHGVDARHARLEIL